MLRGVVVLFMLVDEVSVDCFGCVFQVFSGFPGGFIVWVSFPLDQILADGSLAIFTISVVQYGFDLIFQVFVFKFDWFWWWDDSSFKCVDLVRFQL